MANKKSNAIVSTNAESVTPDLFLKELPPLTKGQLKCLEFILDFFIRHRHYPTHREILEGLQVDGNNADQYLKPLESKGYLVRLHHKHRSVRLTADACEKLKLEGVDVEGRLTAANSSRPHRV